MQSPENGREEELAGDFAGDVVSHFCGREGTESRSYRGRKLAE